MFLDLSFNYIDFQEELNKMLSSSATLFFLFILKSRLTEFEVPQSKIALLYNVLLESSLLMQLHSSPALGTRFTRFPDRLLV